MRKEKITKFKVTQESTNKDGSLRTFITNCTKIKNTIYDNTLYTVVIDGHVSPSFTFKDWQTICTMMDELFEMQVSDRNNPVSL